VQHARWIVAALILTFSAILIFLVIDGLTIQMQVAITVFIISLVAWTVLDLPETPVALACAIVLAMTGAVSSEAFYGALGNDIIWLMLGAFILSAVLQASGLVERLVLRNLTAQGSIASLFRVLTLVVFMTAFIVPSTSARAAILLPVYTAIAGAIAQPAINRALALLFPSAILLSAGASLTGAGAHLVAVDFIRRTGHGPVGFIDWIAYAGPFSLLITMLACEIILRLFLTREQRRLTLPAFVQNQAGPGLDRPQKLLLGLTGVTIVLFATTGLHGLEMPMIAMVSALLATSKWLSSVPFKKAIKLVEWNLLLFLAATLVIGEALLSTGTADLIAKRNLEAMRTQLAGYPVFVIGFAAIVGTFAHVVINSRTARVTVLIPALALPLAGLGVAAAPLILVVTLASGFCQTLLVSAKPVTLFGSAEPKPFTQGDLLKLAAVLIIPFILLLVTFATVIWPLQGLTNR